MINILVLLGCTLFKLLFCVARRLILQLPVSLYLRLVCTWIDVCSSFLALVTTFIVVWLAEYSVKIAVFLVEELSEVGTHDKTFGKNPKYLVTARAKNVRKKLQKYLVTWAKTFGKRGFNVIPLHLFIYALFCLPMIALL